MFIYTEANNTIQSIYHKRGNDKYVPPTPSDSSDISSLKKEVGELRERVADLQSDKILLEEELKEFQVSRDAANSERSKVCFQLVIPIPKSTFSFHMAYLSFVSQVLQLEKSNKNLSKELHDLKIDIEGQQVKIRQQTKELKDAVAAKKMAMEEFTDLNIKVCVHPVYCVWESQ